MKILKLTTSLLITFAFVGCASAPTEDKARWAWVYLDVSAPKPILRYHDYQPQPEEQNWKIVNPSENECFGKEAEKLDSSICNDLKGFMNDVKANKELLNFTNEKILCQPNFNRTVSELQQCVKQLTEKIKTSQEILNKYKNSGYAKKLLPSYYKFVTFYNNLAEVNSLMAVQAEIPKKLAEEKENVEIAKECEPYHRQMDAFTAEAEEIRQGMFKSYQLAKSKADEVAITEKAKTDSENIQRKIYQLGLNPQYKNCAGNLSKSLKIDTE
ncbi:MAG: hypothetical protein ABL930_09900 [Pseudobdellovibrio sp.]